MADAARPNFTWEFLEEIANWTLGIGVAIAIIGAIITRSSLFAVALLAGVLADVALTYTTAHRANRADSAEPFSPNLAWLFVGGRLVIKTIVLVAAFFAEAASTFWGAVIGVVLFDTVLLTFGSVRAASSMLQAKER